MGPFSFRLFVSSFVAFTTAALTVLLAGCSSAFQATGDTIFYAVDPDRRVRTAKLNPHFEYLRVVVEGRPALLARGAIDRRNDRDLEVFFSATGEVLKISSGRIEEYSGEKRHVLVEPLQEGYPAWDTGAPIEYRVTVDDRRGYQFSAQQRRRLRPLATPPKQSNLKDIDPSSLQWFEETSVDLSVVQKRSLFGIRLEPGGPQIVYSEQCIAVDLCLSLQRWRASGSY